MSTVLSVFTRQSQQFKVTLARVVCPCSCHSSSYDTFTTFSLYAKNATQAIEKAEKAYCKRTGFDPGEVAVIDLRRETGPLEWSGEIIEI